jgi:hypothetical protein
MDRIWQGESDQIWMRFITDHGSQMVEAFDTSHANDAKGGAELGADDAAPAPTGKEGLEDVL